MTVTEVTYAVGFSDLKHFRSLFQERFGVLPGEYTGRAPRRNTLRMNPVKRSPGPRVNRFHRPWSGSALSAKQPAEREFRQTRERPCCRGGRYPRQCVRPVALQRDRLLARSPLIPARYPRDNWSGVHCGGSTWQQPPELVDPGVPVLSGQSITTNINEQNNTKEHDPHLCPVGVMMAGKHGAAI